MARRGGTPENLKRVPKGGPSPNPAGKPKGTRSLSTILKEMLETEIDVTVEGVKTKKELRDVMIQSLIKKAAAGDLKAIEQIFDRVEGRAKQQTDVNITAAPFILERTINEADEKTDRGV